ncbi:hypothetical protein HWV62_9905 [Athelia sp. TMB]|nr:hypothetical protein HWV62_9905 [Athelia sp. TMB]
MIMANKFTEWTAVQGFFVLMGGFDDMEPGDIPHQLSPDQVRDLVRDGSLITPTKSEIRAKGTVDNFSKSTSLVQIVWFIMQFFARLQESLSVTKLEILALSYTLVSMTMYLFWWDKPQSVTQPVRVRRRLTPSVPTTRVHAPEADHEPDLFADRLPSLLNFRHTRGFLFYAGTPTNFQILLADAMGLFYAMVLGGFIVAACLLTSPSGVEMLMWRVSSIKLVAIPTTYMALIAIYAFKQKIPRCLLIASFAVFPVYFLARISILVLAITTLRSLPPGELSTVQWTTFLPHI